MGYIAGLTELAKAALRNPTQAHHIISRAAPSVSTPSSLKYYTDTGDIIRRGVDVLTNNKYGNILGRPKRVDVPPLSEELKQYESSLDSALDEYELVEVQCTDSTTGVVRTHNYQVPISQLADVLANPQQLVLASGDDGCSGEDGKNIGINASVL